MRGCNANRDEHQATLLEEIFWVLYILHVQRLKRGRFSLPSGDDIHAYFSDCLLHVPKALLLQCFRLAFGPKPCMSTNSDFSTSKTHMIKGVRTWVRKGIAWRILGPFLATAPSEDHRPAALQSVGRDCCQPSQGTLGHPLYIYIHIMCIYIYIYRLKPRGPSPRHEIPAQSPEGVANTTTPNWQSQSKVLYPSTLYGKGRVALWFWARPKVCESCQALRDGGTQETLACLAEAIRPSAGFFVGLGFSEMRHH